MICSYARSVRAAPVTQMYFACSGLNPATSLGGIGRVLLDDLPRTLVDSSVILFDFQVANVGFALPQVHRVKRDASEALVFLEVASCRLTRHPTWQQAVCPKRQPTTAGQALKPQTLRPRTAGSAISGLLGPRSALAGKRSYSDSRRRRASAGKRAAKRQNVDPFHD